MEPVTNRDASLNASAFFTHILQDSISLQRRDPYRTLKVRFSGLPFCGLKWILGLEGQNVETQSQMFGFRFYVNIGTLVHTLVQKSVLADHEWKFEVYRDYLCRSCRHRVLLSKKVIKNCPKCSSKNVTAEEHEVNWNGALGHIDEIIAFPDSKGKKRRMILDYKTTSVAKAQSKKNLVSAGYRFQIKSYAVALADEGNPVDYTGFVFIPRDNPERFVIQGAEEFTDKEYNFYSRRLTQSLEEHSACSSFLKSPDRSVAVNIIKSRPCAKGLQPEFSDCEYAKECPNNSRHMFSKLEKATDSSSQVYIGILGMVKK